MVIYTPRYLFDHLLPLVVALQILLYVSLFLNLPLAREVIGIAYLTFIPGLVFLKLIRLHDLETLEILVFSVGFSVAFLMLAGLLISQFGYLLGLTFPLATLPLSLLINTLVIIGAAAAYLKGHSTKAATTPEKSGLTLPMLVLTLIPILSIIGTYFVNATGNNFFLLLMILSIAAIFTVTVLIERSTKIYPFAIFMIAIALLFHVSLISNYILPYGSDAPAEFFVFRDTQISGLWNPVFTPNPLDQGFGRFNAMLSVTVLPTVYSNVIGMDPTWVFKIIYPLIFAFVPIALYLLWQPYIGKRLSFIAVFLFMAQSTFFMEITSLSRQMIGELFFVLLLLLLLNKKVSSQSKFIGFAILGFSLIFSHYALSEIFLFLIFTAWIVSVFYLKKPSFNLQLTTIIFFFVAMFGWYIYTSGAVVFDSFLSFTSYVTSQLGGFFNPASRGLTVLTGLGFAESPSLLNSISRGFAYLTEIFIILGIIGLVRKKTPFKFERDFTVFSLVALAFLISLTIVPGLANTLNMTRFYHILLMILAPFCVIGMWTFAQYISKQRRKVVFLSLAIIVLVPYFMFQTNFVYEVAKTDSWSIPLSGYRMPPLMLYGTYGYIDTYSVYGAQWVSNYGVYKTAYNSSNIAADNGLYTALTAYGLVYRGYVAELKNSTVLRSGEFVYLSYISIEYQNELSNGTYSSRGLLNQTDVVYSNGGTEVRYVP